GRGPADRSVEIPALARLPADPQQRAVPGGGEEEAEDVGGLARRACPGSGSGRLRNLQRVLELEEAQRFFHRAEDADLLGAAAVQLRGCLAHSARAGRPCLPG